jgi:YbgC/YbaW family acyl-CoA thioester hydrolase
VSRSERRFRGEWPAFAPGASVDVVVGYADTDAQGRVYYGRYSRYLDEARFLLWGAAGFDEAELRRLEHATVTVRLEIEYRGPAEFHDRLRVTAGLEALGRTSIVFRYAVHHADGRPVLDARQVSVQVDLAAGARPLPWSDEDRMKLAPLVGRRR